MDSTKNISASIVVYKEEPAELQKAINSFLNYTNSSRLYIVDNSPTNEIEKYIDKTSVEYIFVGKNIGFGAGHNLILNKIKHQSKYHLILNPDVSFNSGILDHLVNQLEKDNTLALIAPKVLFPNGNFQNSCRRYPKLSELFFRRLPLIKKISKPIIDNGIYADRDLNTPFYAEYLTGCFHLYKTEDFIALKGFDERYFLYMEDVDICKKIDAFGKKKMYYPKVQISHFLKQESSKKVTLFFRHFISMIKYYKKWGF